jgi:hypothetical protein
MHLDRARARADAKAAQIRVQPGGQQIPDRARRRASAHHVTDEARMPDVTREVEEQLPGVRHERRIGQRLRRDDPEKDPWWPRRL